MSRSTKQVFKTVGFAAVVVGILGASGYGIMRIMATDSLQRFREPGPPPDQGLVVRDFEMKTYNGDKLVAYAKVDQAIIRKDRSQMDLVGIQEGWFLTQDGEKIDFEAESAVYQVFSKNLLAEQGARLRGKDFDLKVATFTYQGNTEVVSVEGKVTGTLFGGEFETENIRIEVAEGRLTSGTFSWQGTPQVEGQPQRTSWNFRGATIETVGGVSTFTEGIATSSDTIIRGKKIVFDRNEDTITAEGDVKYFGVDANMTCAKAVVTRRDRRVLLTGRVNMLIKPETETAPKEVEIPPLKPFVPDEISVNRPAAPRDEAQRKQDDEIRGTDNLRQFPIAIIAERVEYFYRRGERRATITGSPQARQELGSDRWRLVWSNRAEWDGEKDRLKLFSRQGAKDVRMRNSLGDDMRATFIEVSTRKNEDLLSAKDAEGTMNLDDDEDLPRSPATPPPGSSPSAPPLQGPIGRD
ncbi:MAG: hypothetical protein MUC92_03455 [Fimbriimonadaceae bacterium]|jgi:hypothetical protein|nr:hypothetical protein [Fimbriimonadaceae bacterium]